MKKEDSITFLGKDSRWEGKLSFQGTMRIDGYFNGEITSEGNLIIGDEAIVQGEIHASYIVISGEVQGNIFANQRVDIHSPGKVFGNIQAPSVVMGEGVIFEGMSRMYRAKDVVGQGEIPLVGQDTYAGGPPTTLTAIHGIVTDAFTGNPIKNARTRCKGSDKRMIHTNASGYYELINLRDGICKLKVEAKGYKDAKAKIVISGKGTYEQNFQLKPKKDRLGTEMPQNDQNGSGERTG